jgi:prepilin-type N-terminal cleavage/methylation domain-containing protein
MKLAAFTLFEMIIAMALLSIVIALVYTSVSMAGGRVQDYSKGANEHLQLLAFSQHLEEDMALAAHVVWDNDGTFSVFNYDGTNVTYRLENAFLYRQQNAVLDSIPARTIEVNALNSQTPNGRSFLRELWVETQLFGQPLRLYFFKNYHAADKLLQL